jgi:hypothetical protein
MLLSIVAILIYIPNNNSFLLFLKRINSSFLNLVVWFREGSFVVTYYFWILLVFVLLQCWGVNPGLCAC